MSDKTELDLDAERASFEALTPRLDHHKDWKGDYSHVDTFGQFAGWLLARRATIQPTAGEMVYQFRSDDGQPWSETSAAHIDTFFASRGWQTRTLYTAPVAPADAVRDAERDKVLERDLPEDRLNHIARQYFAAEEYQSHVKHAISDAFKEARALLATPTSASQPSPARSDMPGTERVNPIPGLPYADLASAVKKFKAERTPKEPAK